MKTTIVWYRNDLRTHDHQPLADAVRHGDTVVPVYCLDPRHFDRTSFGFPKTGGFRQRFLVESLADLRRSLRTLGSDLVFRHGRPETEVPKIARESKATAVAFHAEVTTEETSVESGLRRALDDEAVELHEYHGATLLHPDDLPFAIDEVPAVFTRFRRIVERSVEVRTQHDTPTRLAPLPAGLDPGELPPLEPATTDPRGVLAFRGGERAGLSRIEQYFWDRDRLREYKETRNGMLGEDYSSKLSSWLAHGCISPRLVHDEVRRYEQERVANDSTYWMIFELLWRDYFRLICTAYGNRVFRPSGIRGLPIAWGDDPELFRAWQEGRTGYPLIDANMRELAATGFMSNRGRQNVASFLTKNLGLDWRMGAEWFESLLIDYDVCSNWGNWNYTAGVGNDARGFRYFNTTKQARDYDAQGRYVKHWLPELKSVPADRVHEPWRLSQEDQARFGVRIGTDYPRPIVDFQASLKASERKYLAATR